MSNLDSNRLYINEKKVREWLAIKDVIRPTIFWFESPRKCLCAAWGYSGLEMSYGDFVDALHLGGYSPVQIGNRREEFGAGTKGVFELRLPPVLSLVGGTEHHGA